mgnify:CR=1 FL=1
MKKTARIKKSGNQFRSLIIGKEGKALASIEEKVESLIKNKVESLGYDLYDVQYSKEGKDYFLRVFIDKQEGIDLEDCEKVSNEINPILDDADYIKEMYFLEVSSPGIERIIRKEKHFENAQGKEIEVKLFKPIEKQKEFTGILKKWDENTIYIAEEENEIQIERKNISLMKLKFNWN